MINAADAKHNTDLAAPYTRDAVINSIEQRIWSEVFLGKYSLDLPVSRLMGLDPVEVLQIFWERGFTTGSSGSQFYTISWHGEKDSD